MNTTSVPQTIPGGAQNIELSPDRLRHPLPVAWLSTTNSPNYQLSQSIRPGKRFTDIVRGQVCIRVRHNGRAWDKKRRKNYHFHFFSFYELDPATGQFLRHREKRALKKDALARADQVAIRLANNETVTLSRDDQARWKVCQSLAAQANADPVVLMSRAAAFEKRRPAGVTDDDLLRSWIRHHPAGLDERHIPKIVEEFLAKRILSAKYRRNLETILGRFSGKFDCPLSHLQPRDIEDWLDGLTTPRRSTPSPGGEGRGEGGTAGRRSAPSPGGEGRGEGGTASGGKVGLRTRHNHRAAVENLIGFARDRGYLDKDWNALDQVTDPAPPAAAVDLYTPEDLAKLLARAEKTKAGRKLVPLICITAFCGVRHGEMNEEKIEALDWANFDWEAKKIYIDADAAKQTGRTEGDDRVVDIPDNLITWLAPYKRTTGKICSLVNTSNALCRLRKKAGITGRRKNALRKSYINYRLALGASIDATALQAGNSPGVIRKSYRAARHTRLRAVAAKWFTLMPNRTNDLDLWAWANRAAN